MKVWISDNEHFNFHMELPDDPSVTVIDLKKEIKKETGVKVEMQDLFYRGKRLYNKTKLNFCGFHPDTEITLRVLPPTTRVTVVFQGQRHPVEVQDNTTVFDLKQQVEDDGFPVPIVRQELEYDEDILVDDRTLSSYAIPHAAELRLIEKYWIEVAYGDVRYQVLVFGRMRVWELKELIQQETGVHAEIMRLRLPNGTADLDDFGLLSDYNIKRRDVILIHE